MAQATLLLLSDISHIIFILFFVFIYNLKTQDSSPEKL